MQTLVCNSHKLLIHSSSCTFPLLVTFLGGFSLLQHMEVLFPYGSVQLLIVGIKRYVKDIIQDQTQQRNFPSTNLVKQAVELLKVYICYELFQCLETMYFHLVQR